MGFIKLEDELTHSRDNPFPPSFFPFFLTKLKKREKNKGQKYKFLLYKEFLTMYNYYYFPLK